MSIFSNILSKRPQASDFNLSHTRKFSMNPGLCTPTLCQEILPSDKWNYDMSALVRFMPMQAPVMHMVDVYNYSFFVPARLCMQRGTFETFITGGKAGDGKDAQGNTIQIPFCNIRMTSNVNSATYIAYNVLKSQSLSGSPDSLADFLGVQFGEILENTSIIKLNMMPFIAFWRIWCQYFRDQNLHPDYESLYPGIFEATGDITAAIYAAMVTNAADPTKFMDFFNVPRVCWEKDYFTSALPFAQRGNPVETPLSGSATVSYRSQAIILKPASASAGDLRGGTALNAPLVFTEGSGGAGTNYPAGLDNISSIDLATGGFTINQLRLATRLQEWLEKMARGGSRYIEQIKQHFGVTSSDARLQRPEFLGGGKIPVHISEVLATDQNETASQPLGAQAGHGVTSGQINSFSRFFEEHGFIISVMFVRPRTAYQEGVPRLFTQRFDKLDWAWPSFAHLGEQAILNKEVYFRNNAVDNLTFGYQQRYAEYKYIPSTVHSEFKDELSFWHWGRIFADELTNPSTETPTLGRKFVEAAPSNRIFNVLDVNLGHVYCIVNNRIKARRPLPYFSNPTL